MQFTENHQRRMRLHRQNNESSSSAFCLGVCAPALPILLLGYILAGLNFGVIAACLHIAGTSAALMYWHYSQWLWIERRYRDD